MEDFKGLRRSRTLLTGSREVQGGLRNSGVSPWFLIRMISYRKGGESILSLKDQHIRSLKDQIATLTSESESCKDAVTSVVKKELSIVSISDWCPRTMIPFLHQHIVTQEEIEEMNMNVVDAKGIRRQVELVHSAPWQTDISDMEYPLKLTLVLKKVTPPIDAGSLPIHWRELRPT